MEKFSLTSFDQLYFSKSQCFLTGLTINPEKDLVSVFPEWLLEKGRLHDQAFKLLDEQFISYKDLKVPCSPGLFNEFIEPLHQEMKEVFLSGYDAAKSTEELRLFQWLGLLWYGIFYSELIRGRQQASAIEPFTISGTLFEKAKHHHLFLQSIFLPMEFENFQPWSLFIFKLKQQPDAFEHRDELHTFLFSLSINDVGVIISLQDNGELKNQYKPLLSKVNEQVLHPVQYMEIAARLFYSAYLFTPIPQYIVLNIPGKTTIEAMGLNTGISKPLFDEWQVKTYVQVLEAFWKKWGIGKLEIAKNPEHAITFLENEKGEWMRAEHIDLPL